MVARVDVGNGESLSLAAAGAACDSYSQALLAWLEYFQLLIMKLIYFGRNILEPLFAS